MLIALGFLGRPPAAAAQTLTAAGGTSNLLNASGVELGYQWQPVTGWVGLGIADGVQVGGFLGTTYHGFDFGAGDRYYPFILDTDVFDQSYIFYGRGLSFGRRSERQQWTLFGGTSAAPFSTPFLRAYERGRAAGAFFFERRLSPRLIFHSFNIVGNRATSIQSLGLTLDPHWKLAGAAGIGENSGFFSFATQYQYRWLAVTGSWTANNERFRRLAVLRNLAYPERTGANVRVQLTPLSHLGFQLDHETLLSPVLGSSESLRASLNSASVFGSLGGFSMQAGVSGSKGRAFSTDTQMFTVTRALGSRLLSYGAILRVRTQGGKASNLYLTTVEEKLTRRLSVRETFTHTANNNTIRWGGRFLSNPVVLGIDYETVFNPLAGALGGHTFVGAWAVNLQIHLPGGLGFHYDTFVDPFGRVRYTAFADGIRYGRGREGLAAPATTGPGFGRYLIRGVVQDERGSPVWGIAVQVDGQYVYSDSQGEFFLRVKHAGDYPLTVLGGRSLNPGRWKVVRAPATAPAGPRAFAAVIVVQRVPSGSLR